MCTFPRFFYEYLLWLILPFYGSKKQHGVQETGDISYSTGKDLKESGRGRFKLRILGPVTNYHD
jgi:hypothetical protein